MANSRLDQYLHDYRVRLNFLSQGERVAEVTEVRQHLENLIDSAVDQGTAPDVAAQSAIYRFGAPQKHAAALRRSCYRKWLGTVGPVIFRIAVFNYVLRFLWEWQAQRGSLPGVFISHVQFIVYALPFIVAAVGLATYRRLSLSAAIFAGATGTALYASYDWLRCVQWVTGGGENTLFYWSAESLKLIGMGAAGIIVFYGLKKANRTHVRREKKHGQQA